MLVEWGRNTNNKCDSNCVLELAWPPLHPKTHIPHTYSSDRLSTHPTSARLTPFIEECSHNIASQCLYNILNV